MPRRGPGPASRRLWRRYHAALRGRRRDASRCSRRSVSHQSTPPQISSRSARSVSLFSNGHSAGWALTRSTASWRAASSAAPHGTGRKPPERRLTTTASSGAGKWDRPLVLPPHHGRRFAHDSGQPYRCAMSWPAPTFQPIWLACKACGHKWDDWQPAHVPVATWVAHVRTYHCPKCGKGRRTVLLRQEPLSSEEA